MAGATAEDIDHVSDNMKRLATELSAFMVGKTVARVRLTNPLHGTLQVDFTDDTSASLVGGAFVRNILVGQTGSLQPTTLKG